MLLLVRKLWFREPKKELKMEHAPLHFRPIISDVVYKTDVYVSLLFINWECFDKLSAYQKLTAEDWGGELILLLLNIHDLGWALHCVGLPHSSADTSSFFMRHMLTNNWDERAKPSPPPSNLSGIATTTAESWVSNPEFWSSSLIHLLIFSHSRRNQYCWKNHYCLHRSWLIVQTKP